MIRMVLIPHCLHHATTTNGVCGISVHTRSDKAIRGISIGQKKSIKGKEGKEEGKGARLIDSWCLAKSVSIRVVIVLGEEAGVPIVPSSHDVQLQSRKVDA